MDGYAEHYVAHNVPLVALSGLGVPDPNASDEIERQYTLLQDGGFRITSELPEVTSSKAEDILSCFRDLDARDAAWNNRPGKGKMGSMGFTYRTVGRTFIFPPRKADWPSLLEDREASNGSQRPSIQLHSPLSPLSPSSPTYPDGIMTSLWFTKHQLILPSALLIFFTFTSDQNHIVLEDNKIKNEINSLKTQLNNSGFKTRLGIVLVADAIEPDPSAAERIANLRRATVLDAKSLFHLPGFSTSAELRAFVGIVLSALQPACVEYYRDLSKHARRKRSRGSTPLPTITPTSGTSQTLSSQGWAVRYETKLGVLAEFRQEMDTAGRNYEAAYESLVDGEIFETLSDWSPRFNENRMLADVLAIRIIRCLLWTGQTTSAVQSWTNHKNRIRDLVDRRGKGTHHYGWQAWEARWSLVMAEILDRVGLSVFHSPQELKSPGGASSVTAVIAPPEKSFGNDPRLAPWDFLHHSGYWFSQAAQRLRLRKVLAKSIPPEDCVQPGQSPASAVASRVQQYDTFLCPEPYEERSIDHSLLLISTLTQAAEQYSSHDGLRSAERAYLEIAKEHVGAGRWTDAMEVLRPVWQTLSWRRSGWWELVFQASSSMKKCAVELEDWETYLATQWELLSNCLPYRDDATCNFPHCLDEYRISSKPYAKLDFHNLAPTFTASFTFSKSTGNAGVPELAQLIIASCAHRNSSPISFASIELSFEGGLKEVHIAHNPNAEPTGKQSDHMHYFDIDAPGATDNVDSQTGGSQSSNTVDLRFHPGDSKVLLIKLLPRDAGEVRASAVTLKVQEKAFEFDMKIPLRERAQAPLWWAPSAGGLSRQKLDLDRYCALTVLPKPPKLQLSLTNFPIAFYTDEVAEIPIHLLNQEEDVADITLSASLSGSKDGTPLLQIDSSTNETGSIVAADGTSTIDHIVVGKLSPKAVAERSIFFRALPGTLDLILLVRADYSLISDPETPITVHLKEKVHITAPFEAGYEYVPQPTLNPWPSYFIVEQTVTHPLNGLQQDWHVAAKVTSFAEEILSIRDLRLEATDVKYAARCDISTPKQESVAQSIEPHQRIHRSFHIAAQKADLEDRRAGLANLQLLVDWHRPGNTQKITTTRLLIPSLTIPFGEPRVLCSATQVAGDPHLVNLTYTLENPSTHLLSFSVTMETSDEFAFTGAKARILQLVPLSRTEVRYTLIPFHQQAWIHPYLRVTDTGFGQDLKTHAASGCRNEKKAIAVFVTGEETPSVDK